VALRLVRFGLAGLLSATLVLGLTAALREGAGVPPQAAFAVALVVAYGFNFAFNRRFVFRSRGPAARQLGLYAAGSAAFRLGEYLLFLLLLEVFGLPYLGAAGAALIVSFLGKFAFFGRVVFPAGRAEVR
jgi:putative flippase GtrA